MSFEHERIPHALTHSHTCGGSEVTRARPTVEGFSDDDGFLPSLGAREVVTSLTPEKNGLYVRTLFLPFFLEHLIRDRRGKTIHFPVLKKGRGK